MKKFKRHRDYGFFDQDIRLSKLSTLGDPLERLNNHVDFEMFRTLLQDTLTPGFATKSKLLLQKEFKPNKPEFLFYVLDC